jgi:gamma-glutamyltranspeptidase/glutathione hydrolase
MLTLGAIASPHSLATQSGERVFRDGGTAVDAAIATCAVLTVVYPHMNSIGGDIQALLALPDGRTRALGGSGAAAAALSAQTLRGKHASMPIHGAHPITVPGVIAAWADLHAQGGRLPWARLLEDAIALAHGGVPVAAALGRDLDALQARLRLDSGLRGVFFRPDGSVLRTGEVVRQPALAASLLLIAEGGPDAFYKGEVGANFVNGVQAQGSLLTRADLANHHSRWLEPLSTPFGPYEILTTPPVSQGFVLLQLLAALRELDLERADPCGEAATALARLCAITADLRDHHLGDPEHVLVDIAHLLSEGVIGDLVLTARDLTRPMPTTPPRPRPNGDTVAIVAQDALGHSVTVIQSIFHAFGAGMLESSTGIVCQNRGAAFTLHEGPAVLAGGRIPPSTLTASLLRRNGHIEAALGCMGGKSQPQILAQVLMRLLAGATPADALAAPRWVVGTFGQGNENVVLAEAALGDAGRQALSRVGLPLVFGAERDDRAGHVQFVRRHPSGQFESATDPRGDGQQTLA